VSVINNVSADEFTSELVIGEFQPADQATYKCVARNVYNDTVETSTRICKTNGVDENYSPVKSSLSKVVKNIERDVGLFLPHSHIVPLFLVGLSSD